MAEIYGILDCIFGHSHVAGVCIYSMISYSWKPNTGNSTAPTDLMAACVSTSRMMSVTYIHLPQSPSGETIWVIVYSAVEMKAMPVEPDIVSWHPFGQQKTSSCTEMLMWHLASFFKYKSTFALEHLKKRLFSIKRSKRYRYYSIFPPDVIWADVNTEFLLAMQFFYNHEI